MTTLLRMIKMKLNKRPTTQAVPYGFCVNRVPHAVSRAPVTLNFPINLFYSSSLNWTGSLIGETYRNKASDIKILVSKYLFYI
jgi:hypothetical protein